MFKKRFFYIGSKIGGVLYRYTRVLFFFVTMVGHAAAFNVTRTRYTLNTIAGVSLFSFIVQFLLIIFFFFFLQRNRLRLRFITIEEVYALSLLFLLSFFFLPSPSFVGCSLLDPSATPLLFSTPSVYIIVLQLTS